MSFADDDELAEFAAGGHLLPMVTQDALASALKGFVLPLLPGKGLDWLATAVRRSLGSTIRSQNNAPERTSNADIRDELERLAGLAGSTWLELFTRDDAADSRIWDHAWRHWDGQGGADIGGGQFIGEPTDYGRFKSALAELDWLSFFLREAANSTVSQRGPWRESEEKKLRIERGQYLAPIFEAAFGERVSANNWPSGTHRGPSAFMDFYQRMVALAFNENATPNISGVLKAACQKHRQHPVELAEGLIPGL